MSYLRIHALVVSFLLASLPNGVRAGEPFRFPEAKHAKGELRYVNGIPVLTVRGTPREIGEQVGVLALRPAKPLFGRVQEFAKAWRIEAIFPLLLKTGSVMAGQSPADHLQELEAAARASGISRDLLMFGNTFLDIKHLGGCSTLVVEPERSATGRPLFGRNLDWFPFGDLYQYSLVTIYHPEGKQAFVSIGLPGLVGCLSGMNESGLALAANEVDRAGDGSVKLDPRGVPSLFALRRVLEECHTVAEAEKLMRSLRRPAMGLLTVCDPQQGLALEITTSNVIARRPAGGICASTNHFRTRELAIVGSEVLQTEQNCPRYVALVTRSRGIAKLTVEDVHRLMDAANGGEWTFQTMIFEPAALRVHVALGKGPTSALPLKSFDMGPWFKAAQARK